MPASTTVIVYGLPATVLVALACVCKVGLPATFAVTGVSPFLKPESVNISEGLTDP